MKKTIIVLLIAAVCLAITGTAVAVTEINDDIEVSEIWTKAGNPYELKKQIYVKPGATLTIEAGVIVANDPVDQGSLAVTRGAKIYINGTKDEPVIMSNQEDLANNFEVWQEDVNTWGNLTMLGNAYIGGQKYDGVIKENNIRCPDEDNVRIMEGLAEEFAGDPNVRYGGGNDDDDSGSISYLSLRYGGKVIGFANELNGLSLGGIGRGTDIDHVDIMNNVDDGIEIWGGTVCLKYCSIWNIGDDSFDFDQGWRGCAQYGLIVQGYSVDASQGSGVGDNCFEHDGAEDSDAQPLTTATITNFTVVGQPVDGDGATAWRDNARVQYSNCIFMDIGEKIVRYDGDDGDGQSGYGYNNTLDWEDTWTWTYNDWVASPNATIVGDPNCTNPIDYEGIYANYMCQDPNKPLANISNSVFFRNQASNAYDEAIARGVFDPQWCNVIAVSSGEVNDPNMPIQELQRAAPVTKGGKTMVQVTYINPCANADAVTSYSRALDCNCKTSVECIQPAPFVGGFSPYYNWLEGWTAADMLGWTDTSMNTPSDSTSMSIPDDGDLDNDMDVDNYDLGKLANTWLEDK